MDRLIKSSFENIKIAGIASAVSNKWTSIDSFYGEIGEQTVEKFKKTTGVMGRYDAGPKQCTSDFCYISADSLLKDKRINPDEIGALVFVSQTPDYNIPATACVIHDRLGLSKNCIAFDVNLGCSGYVYGINIVASLMTNSNIDKALLLVGDTSAKKKNKLTKDTENSFNMLFGDSGSCTLISKEPAKTINTVLCTDGSGYKAIINIRNTWRHPESNKKIMDDVAVFNFTISEVPKTIRDFMDITSTKPDDYDCLVPHQANLFVLKQLAKRTGFPIDKILVSIDKFGNTSSSSIPITLVKHYGEKRSNETIKTLMSGFGVGLSWGVMSAQINVNDILPLVHTDEYFDDGIPD